jgi:hypothetical protein
MIEIIKTDTWIKLCYTNKNHYKQLKKGFLLMFVVSYKRYWLNTDMFEKLYNAYWL